MQNQNLKSAPAPTCRVFFDELLKSDCFVEEHGETHLITPTCARCNRLFGVGEIKEVEKRGNITKIKISDPTATFGIYTDKALLDLKPKKNLAFVAYLRPRLRAHAEKNKGKGKGALTLVEEAGVVDENVRTNWILNTGRRTMERIELLRKNLSLEKKALPKKQEKVFSESTLKEAMEHYAIDDDKLNYWQGRAIDAVNDVWQRHGKTAKEMVLDILEQGVSGKSSVERIKLMEELKKRGLMEEWVEEVIDELIVEGRCYEPEVGMLKVVEE
jgi:RPA family protein